MANLIKNQIIDNKYTVSFFLKKGSYAETYRVSTADRKTLFLKLFDYTKLHRSQFTKEGDILEIEILKSIKHPNLVSFCDNGEIFLENKKFAYAVLDFISGETLADKMKREQTLNQYKAKNIISGVLNGVNYLHQLKKPIIHNDICNSNIMLDFSGKIPIPKLIDFGYARYLHQSNKDFLKEGLNPFYQANEVFNKVFSEQSDVFSIGALYYHLLTGLPPWFIEISKYKSNTVELEDVIAEERTKPLKFPNNIDELTQNIIIKALHSDTESRFKNIKQFIQAINGELEVEQVLSKSQKSIKINSKTPKSGGGFSAIAGMQDLKDTIQLDIIDALNNKEKYAEYGLTIPNGMLLYGPPGCGKTFFAERMAEEIGFQFYQIKPSDIQSKWVNASQENIKNLFDEAKKNAPSIIFIDELDALVPSRDSSSISHMNTSAVNEFLAQMNNCGEDGIFVVGATNRPNAIDPAIMRAGRLDKHIYIPPPDFKARKQMFQLYLKKRPIEIGIDYVYLAEITENYVSGDIKLLCDEASRKALKLNSRITNTIIINTIQSSKPSLSIEQINNYEKIRDEIEQKAPPMSNRTKIGFKN